MHITAPYGSWKSPITAEMLISGGKRRLNEIKIDGSDIYWLDARPAEAGRIVIMRRTADGTVEDLTPAPFNSRNAVHEYGGGSFAVQNRTIYFTNWEDQRIYVQIDNRTPRPLTTEPPFPRSIRYADLTITTNSKYILCVRETHHQDGTEAINEIAAIDTATGEQKTIATGRDFYCAPRSCPSHDGIAWTEWDHPNMPWDGNTLVSGSFNQDDATISTTAPIAGQQDESIVQPTWGPNGLLHFVTDRTGWWNIHAWKDGEPVNLRHEESDHGRPDWQFAFTSYAHLPDNKIALGKGGVTDGSIVLINSGVPPLAGEMSGGQRGLANSTHSIEIPYSEISFITTGPDGTTILFVGASPKAEPAIISLDLETERCSTIYAPSDINIDRGYLSTPPPHHLPDYRQRTSPRLLLRTHKQRLHRSRRRTPSTRNHPATAAQPPPPAPASTSQPTTGPAEASPSSTSTTEAHPGTAKSTATPSKANGASTTPTTASPPHSISSTKT